MAEILWIPAFAGMTEINGNGGVEIAHEWRGWKLYI